MPIPTVKSPIGTDEAFTMAIDLLKRKSEVVVAGGGGGGGVGGLDPDCEGTGQREQSRKGWKKKCNVESDRPLLAGIEPKAI